jgi:hypothetical protein
MRAIAPYVFGVMLAGCIFYGLAVIFGAGAQAIVLVSDIANPGLDIGWAILSGLWNLVVRGAS